MRRLCNSIRSLLLAIPLELRLEIYAYVISEAQPFSADRPLIPPLLRTCTQIRSEAQPEFFASALVCLPVLHDEAFAYEQASKTPVLSPEATAWWAKLPPNCAAREHNLISFPAHWSASGKGATDAFLDHARPLLNTVREDLHSPPIRSGGLYICTLVELPHSSSRQAVKPSSHCNFCTDILDLCRPPQREVLLCRNPSSPYIIADMESRGNLEEDGKIPRRPPPAKGQGKIPASALPQPLPTALLKRVARLYFEPGRRTPTLFLLLPDPVALPLALTPLVS
ncbi:hypothetical protein ANO11243_047390 [Dothideomycetidae sp. 11243]|nr:hypothetical protein ANO11243_047390 [fungal sp. No.11243]